MIREDRTLPVLDRLATDHRTDPLGVHTYLGVTESNCPIRNSGEGGSHHDGTGGGNVAALEPHHAAGRRRTETEDAALSGYAPTSDEDRGLRRSGATRTAITTVHAGSVL